MHLSFIFLLVNVTQIVALHNTISDDAVRYKYYQLQLDTKTKISTYVRIVTCNKLYSLTEPDTIQGNRSSNKTIAYDRPILYAFEMYYNFIEYNFLVGV